MESCTSVDKELDRVIAKFTAIREHTGKVLTDVALSFEDMRAVLGNAGNFVDDSQVEYMHSTLSKIKERLQRISTEHRDLHGTVSKVGKVIDRNFVSDFTATTRTDFLKDECSVNLVNKIVAHHYHRQGMNEIATSLISESKLPKNMADDVLNTQDKYAEIYNIWEAILEHDLEMALIWAAKYSDDLALKNSALEFKLHRLVFMQIIARGVSAQADAIKYARKNFSKLVGRFQTDIQNLMGTLIYLPIGIANSPYKQLIAPEMWTEVSYIFLKDACNTLGISKDSPLSIVVNAGCLALPALLSIKQVMLSRKVLGVWKQRDELPIDIDLNAEYRYHSIFACPILRQQTFEENPPMKLACGHVISRNAWSQLSHGPMLKCPYCPTEQSPDEAKLIFF